MYIFKIYNLMNFDKCILLNNYHPNEDIKHFTTVESYIHLQSILSPCHPKTTSDLSPSPQVSFAILELHMNGILIVYMLLCLAYLTQHHIFEIHPRFHYILYISSLLFFMTGE